MELNYKKGDLLLFSDFCWRGAFLFIEDDVFLFGGVIYEQYPSAYRAYSTYMSEAGDIQYIPKSANIKRTSIGIGGFNEHLILAEEGENYMIIEWKQQQTSSEDPTEPKQQVEKLMSNIQSAINSIHDALEAGRTRPLEDNTIPYLRVSLRLAKKLSRSL